MICLSALGASAIGFLGGFDQLRLDLLALGDQVFPLLLDIGPLVFVGRAILDLQFRQLGQKAVHLLVQDAKLLGPRSRLGRRGGIVGRQEPAKRRASSDNVNVRTIRFRMLGFRRICMTTFIGVKSTMSLE